MCMVFVVIKLHCMWYTQARLEGSGGPGQIDNMGPLYITISNIAYVIRSALCEACQSRGVWGDAPQENFEIRSSEIESESNFGSNKNVFNIGCQL